MSKFKVKKMGKKISLFFFLILSVLILLPFLFSKEKPPPQKNISQDIDSIAYNFFPVNKPQFDYISTLKTNSHPLGLKRDKLRKRILNQPIKSWAIRAVTRHILEKKNCDFFADSFYTSPKGLLDNIQTKIDLLISPVFLGNEELFTQKNTIFSLSGGIDKETRWSVSSSFFQHDLNLKFERWKTTGSLFFSNNKHFLKINIGFKQNRIIQGYNSNNTDIFSGALKFTDTWSITPYFALSYGFRYDYIKWLKSLNLISPNLKFYLSLSESFRLISEISYNWSTPENISFISSEWHEYIGNFYPINNLRPEKALKYSLGFQSFIGNQNSINFMAHYEKIEDQLIKFPYLNSFEKIGPEFIYLIYNFGEREGKGFNITFSREFNSLLSGSISYGLIYSEQLSAEESKVITLPVGVLEDIEKEKVIHIISSLIKARVPITNTVIIANYNWTSDYIFQNVYPLSYLKSRIKIKQELPFFTSYGRIKIVLDLINFLQDNNLLNKNECIILLPFPKRIIGGVEIKF